MIRQRTNDPLPYDEPDRLVSVHASGRSGGASESARRAYNRRHTMTMPTDRSRGCARAALVAHLLAALSVGALLAPPGRAQRGGAAGAFPILFVTQVPVPDDFTTIASVFGNQRSDVEAAPRGGDLWIRDPDGTLRNLTQEAGYGQDGRQGARAIAVREPSVHWTGAKAIFSMVVGSNLRQYEYGTFHWQLYEIVGLGPTDQPVITRVPHQPTGYNNVSPIYGTDDRVIFTSDRPRGGEAHLYPQLDEYEEVATVTGLWSLDPVSGDLFLLQHSPSGSFSPLIDSFGRVVFTRWDHLQRDQQADSDAVDDVYGTFDYADESATAPRFDQRREIFPEPRPGSLDLLGTNLAGHTFNHFFLWQIEEDGTGEETLNHLGRHEIHSYFDRSLSDDGSLTEFIDATSGRVNRRSIDNLLEAAEDTRRPGTYVGVDAPEFYTHAAGQLVELSAPPGENPDGIRIRYLTPRDTHEPTDTPSASHSGLYRDPLPLSDGGLVAVHTAETREDANVGTRASPRSRYDFRLTSLVPSAGIWGPGARLTPGIVETVSYWDPDVLVTYSGPLWELGPVEVRPRPRPARPRSVLESPEARVFAQQGVSVAAFEADLRRQGLALIVSRNVTTRDRADRQQPFNLRVAGQTTRSVGTSGKLYEVSHLQIMQADQIRGIGGVDHPSPGRRVLARPLHAGPARNAPNGGSPGSVAVARDGSVAALVPARRALSWQLLDPAGQPVVRERYWLTLQPGEIRVCGSCHGVNSLDQAGLPAPANEPEALRQLLQQWKR